MKNFLALVKVNNRYINVPLQREKWNINKI